jgi:hypothetical protein
LNRLLTIIQAKLFLSEGNLRQGFLGTAVMLEGGALVAA